MPTCEHCGKPVSLPFTCPRCGLELCPSCRLPPNHDCAELDAWQATPPFQAPQAPGSSRSSPPATSPPSRLRRFWRDLDYSVWRFWRYIQRHWVGVAILSLGVLVLAVVV